MSTISNKARVATPGTGDESTGARARSLTPHGFLSPAAHYDKCVINLREQLKPDMSQVLDCIFSHSQVAKKNQLVIMLIVSRKRRPLPAVGQGSTGFPWKDSGSQILKYFIPNFVLGLSSLICFFHHAAQLVGSSLTRD